MIEPRVLRRLEADVIFTHDATSKVCLYVHTEAFELASLTRFKCCVCG